MSVPDTGYLEKIKKLGCICHETVMERRGMNPLKDGKLLLFYRKLLKTIHPAAVLTYTIKPNIYGGVACRLAKVPYLVNITGLGTTLEHDGPLQKLIVLLYRTGMSGAGCVFFQNEQNLAFMRQKGCLKKRTKTRVISGSGVNLEAVSYTHLDVYKRQAGEHECDGKPDRADSAACADVELQPGAVFRGRSGNAV